MPPLASDDGWDLGGYIPVGYEITPWATLFPNLKLNLPASMSRIYLARLWTFFLTRLEFSQYLFFLADVGGEICENDGIDVDADIFAHCCKGFLEDILSGVDQKGPFLKQNYEDLVMEFGEKVQDLPSKSFRSREVYVKFFEHYKLFKKNPLGFIHAVYFESRQPEHDREYYLTQSGKPNEEPINFTAPNSGYAKVTQPVQVPNMLQDAKRCYPVLTMGGKFKLAWFNKDEGKFESQMAPPPWGDIEPFFPYSDDVNDKGYEQIHKHLEALHGARKYEWGLGKWFSNCKWNTYGVGFEHVFEGRPVIGGPMFGNLPFDKVLGGVEFPGFDSAE